MWIIAFLKFQSSQKSDYVFCNQSSIWNCSVEKNRENTNSNLSELYLRKQKQISFLKTTPTTCNLKCSQVYRFNLNYLLKKGSLFSSVFLSSPEVWKVAETFKITSHLHMLGTVKFSKHLLHSSAILLIFLNPSSLFLIILLYKVHQQTRKTFCLLSCLRLTGDHPKVLDVAHALCSVPGWVNCVNMSTHSSVHR